MKNPVLLDRSLGTVCELHPLSMGLTLTVELSDSASMIMAIDDECPNVGDYVRVYAPNGSDAVHIVTAIDTDYVGMRVTCTLAHVYSELKNILVKTYRKENPKKINDSTPTAALNSALAYAKNWTLGECEYDKTYSQPWDIFGMSVAASVDKVLSCLPNVYITVDCDELPFRLNIRRKSNAVKSEMRMNRNVSGMRLKVDMHDMINSLRVVGARNVTPLDEGQFQISFRDEESIAAYGLHEANKVDQTRKNEAELTAWARNEVNKYKDPAIVATISGLELYESTGVPIDLFEIGTVCQVPLADYGTVVRHRITQLAWPDAIGAPEQVTVTLCNTRQNVTNLHKILNQDIFEQSVGGGGGVGAAQAQEWDQLFYDEQTGAFSRIQQNVGMIRATVSALSGVGVNTIAQHTLTSDYVEDVLRNADSGSIIGGMRTSIARHGEQIKTITELYGDIVKVINRLEVGSYAFVGASLRVTGNVNCNSLTVHGESFGGEYSKVVDEWTAGSYRTTILKYKGASGLTENQQVVTSLSLPKLTTKTKRFLTAGKDGQ